MLKPTFIIGKYVSMMWCQAIISNDYKKWLVLSDYFSSILNANSFNLSNTQYNELLFLSDICLQYSHDLIMSCE